ncbi:MAG: vWA domain-containing protein [Planctomycetaceae bacterium]
MIYFQNPEFFLLAIPLWFFYRRWGRAHGFTGALRVAILASLLLVLTGPEWNIGGRGIDIVVVADRSRSMPASAHDNVRELIQNLSDPQNRGSGDRIGIVTFGSEEQLEQPLSDVDSFESYTKDVLPDGSDLNAAVNRALNQVDHNRPARILVLSDGEANGPSPLSAARRAREEGVPVDFRAYERPRIGDVAVKSIDLPDLVSPREPFQFGVEIYSDGDVLGKVTLLRDGREIVSQQYPLSSGTNRLMFGDLLDSSGLYNYSVRVDVAGDPLPENNQGAGVVRIEAGPKLLVLNNDGQDDNLVRALRAGRVEVDVAQADTHPLTQDALDSYRGVIVENVTAAKFGRLKMERLAQFVEDLGGGLALTGGERSFGTGGYFKSPLDDVLPVSMEMREEHRKTRIALAIALDRSGSMTAPVKGGKTKMDLADLGTAECVRLLSAGDMVAVIAVDSSPHVIQSLVPVEDPESIAGKVLKIQSQGGGIFVYEALVAAGKELMGATDFQTKHIILFSDAADSEEPGDYENLLKSFESSGITVSVIGLGTTSDPHAKLLEDIAKRGRGNIMFTEDAHELPRLFTQDTMSVARNTFIKRDDTQPNGIPAELLPDAKLMGALAAGAFPSVDGYNLSYLKPDATMGVVSRDEYAAPLSAFWYRGVGRAAALTLEVDGKYSGGFGRWESYEDFLITHARWLLGGESPAEAFVQVAREGQDAVVTVELEPDRKNKGQGEAPSVMVVPPGDEREQAQRLDLEWTGPDTLAGRLRLSRTGNYRTVLKTGEGQFSRGPAVTLPYSPEFDPREGQPSGRETLAAVAELSGGVERNDILTILSDPPRLAETFSLLPWLLMLAVGLLVVEIAGRRLSLWQRLVEPAGIEVAVKKGAAAWLPRWKLRLPRGSRRGAKHPEPAVAAHAKPPSREVSRPATPATMTSVLDRAKERARRRLK